MKLQVVTNGGIGYYFPIPFDRVEKLSEVEIFTCFMEPWINSHYFYTTFDLEMWAARSKAQNVPI